MNGIKIGKLLNSVNYRQYVVIQTEAAEECAEGICQDVYDNLTDEQKNVEYDFLYCKNDVLVIEISSEIEWHEA